MSLIFPYEFGLTSIDATPTSGSSNAVSSDGVYDALAGKQEIMQLSTLPTASSELLGKIVQFVGTTTSSYTNGYFYKCEEDTTPGTYKWTQVNVQAGGGGSSVQSDWNQTNTSADDYIKNKPTSFPDDQIGGTATGTSLTLTDATDGYLQGIMIKGHSEVVSGVIKSVGDAGWGVVDLGTLTWVYDSENAYFISNAISNKPVIAGGGDNGLCSNYIVVTNATVLNMPNKSVLVGSGSASSTYRVAIKDTSYTDAATFTTAMSGVILYYPLASTTGATPTLGITAKDDTGNGTAATITTALPLRSVSDSVYDTLDNNEVVKKCGEVDLGTLTWTYNSTDGWFAAISPSDGATPKSGGYTCLCAQYSTYTGNMTNFKNTDKAIWFNPSNITSTIKNVAIRDTSYGTDASAFKAAMSGVKLIYPLATPTTTSLTSAEKSAVATLKTYPTITHIEVTDSPNMTVDYLIDTDNGKAASAIDQKIIVIDVPEMHRMIFRGKNLGSSVSAEQLAAIRDGSFRDLFVGDYWETTVTINATIDGTEVNNTFTEKWRIADINYWMGCGDTAFTSPHLVIVPDIILYSAKMNDSMTTGGYVGSKMYTTNLAPAKTAINAAFPNIVLTHREYLINAVTDDKPSGGAWYDSAVELMNENMVYGHSEYAVGYDTNSKTQLALFQIVPQYIVKEQKQWLRTIASSSKFVFLQDTGVMNAILGTYSQGVRPVFAIG